MDVERGTFLLSAATSRVASTHCGGTGGRETQPSGRRRRDPPPRPEHCRLLPPLLSDAALRIWIFHPEGTQARLLDHPVLAKSAHHAAAIKLAIEKTRADLELLDGTDAPADVGAI